VAKVQVLSNEQPQVTLPVIPSNHAGPLTLLKTQTEQYPNIIGHACIFGLHVTTILKNAPEEKIQQ
jgi:hypothetical protein